MEDHSAPPSFGSFRMDPAEDDPSAPQRPLDDSGGTVGIFTDDGAPAGKLRAIFPILIERWAARNGDRHRCFTDAAGFGLVETKAHAGGQVQAVIGRVIFSGNE